MAMDLSPTRPGRSHQGDKNDAPLPLTRRCMQPPVTSVEVLANAFHLFQLLSDLTLHCMVGLRHVQNTPESGCLVGAARVVCQLVYSYRLCAYLNLHICV